MSRPTCEYFRSLRADRKFFRQMGRNFAKTTRHSTPSGYDPWANVTAEAHVGILARGCRSLLHEAGATQVSLAEAVFLCSVLRNRTKRQIDEILIEPLLLEMKENDGNIDSLLGQDRHRVLGFH